jgi:hypothetical protein
MEQTRRHLRRSKPPLRSSFLTTHVALPTEIERHSLKDLAKEDLVAGVLDTVPFYTAMEDTAVLLELFRKRLDILNRRMEIL